MPVVQRPFCAVTCRFTLAARAGSRKAPYSSTLKHIKNVYLEIFMMCLLSLDLLLDAVFLLFQPEDRGCTMLISQEDTVLLDLRQNVISVMFISEL